MRDLWGTTKRGLDYIEGMSTGRLLACLGVVFAAWHGLLLALGVRFDIFPLGMFAHYADAELLRTRLLESCFYLHVQPPLYNLFLGVVLKLFRDYYGLAFHAVFLLSGYALYVLLVILQTRLGVSRLVAIILSTWFLCSPSFVLFEHTLLYTFHCALLLVLAAVLLHVFVKSGRSWRVWGFFLTLFVLGGIRSMYHLLYYVLAAAGVFVFARVPRRKLVWPALIPFLLLSSFYVKNYVLFDMFGVFSFLGKSPWIKTVGNLSWEQRTQLAAEGKISKVSLVERFHAIEAYPEEFRDVSGYESVLVLRQKTKSTGEVNYNHLSQIAISDQYLEDSLYVLRHYPKTYLCSTVWAWLKFFSPVNTDIGTTFPNLGWLNALYERVFYGRVEAGLSRWWPALKHWGDTLYLTLLLGMPLLVLYGLLQVAGRRSRARYAPEQRAVIAFMCFTICYVAGLSIVLELAETNRYRFETDPFYLVLLGLFIQRVVIVRIGAKRRNAMGGPPSVPAQPSG